MDGALDPSLLPTDDDLLYEEELLRTPFAQKLWHRYLDARKGATNAKRYLLYERALRSLPGSYKLWHAYLRERLEGARGQPPGAPAVEALNAVFERALVTMHKMPRVWEMYLQSLQEQKHITRTRRAADRALAALPVTQHERVWSIFLVRHKRAKKDRSAHHTVLKKQNAGVRATRRCARGNGVEARRRSRLAASLRLTQSLLLSGCTAAI